MSACVCRAKLGMCDSHPSRLGAAELDRCQQLVVHRLQKRTDPWLEFGYGAIVANDAFELSGTRRCTLRLPGSMPNEASASRSVAATT